MMQATVDYTHGVEFSVNIRGHKLICDQPTDVGGSDHGPTPPEFLLASLGTCAGYYAAEYMRTRNLSATGLRVQVNAEKATNPGRLSRFQIEVELPDALEERHREGVLRAVKRCLIHNTLLNAPVIDVEVHVPATI